MNNLVEVQNENPKAVVALVALQDKANEYIAHSKANNTKKAYSSDWSHFRAWCDGHNLQALPANSETVAAYMVELVEKGYKTATLERRLVSIAKAHVVAGHDDVTKTPTIKELWKGIRRTIGTAQTAKSPVLVRDIKVMLATLPDNLLGIRDRALLLLGFSGGFRRSELVSLNVDDLEFTREGLVINLRHSKTDQESAGRKIGVPYGSNIDTCPVRSVQLWLEASNIETGPLFRSINRHGGIQPGRLSDKAVSLVVKRYAEAAGLNPDDYSGHSLRAGLATSAAAAGVSERSIMQQTGHKSVNMVRKYIRSGNLFNDNAVAQLGL